MRKILFILSFLLAGCATDSTSAVGLVAPLMKCELVDQSGPKIDEIVGGETVGLSDPDQKLVLKLKIHRDDTDSICTGALLRDRVILTAAHCVQNAEAGDVSAFFLTKDGCPLGRQQQLEMQAKEIEIHPGFDGLPQSYSDLALIQLRSDAPSDQERLKLTKREYDLSEELLLLGYGITDETAKDSDVLRRVRKPKSEISVREKIVVIDQRTGSGYCRGDSGAPLISTVWTEPMIVGINSSTVGTADNNECHTISVAINTAYFEPWISNRANQLNTLTWFQKVREFVGL